MAREKTVYPTYEIAHLWAHQTKHDARNPQGNHRFEGELLYSYAEPIGRIVKGKGGAAVALYCNQSWSMTTNRHQQRMRTATAHMPHFNVVCIGAIRHSRSGGKVEHKVNLKNYAARIIVNAKQATRARTNKEWRLRELSALVNQANGYSAAFGLATRFDVPSDMDMAKLAEQAKAEAAKEARKNAAAKIEREAREAEFRAKVSAALPSWLQGERTEFDYAFCNLGEAYMRLEGAEVVTTLGARVPVEHVQRALPIVLRLLERGEAYQRNGHSIPVGHYVLDSIGTDGVVKVGCHKFLRGEVERMAKVVASAQPVLG